MPDRTFMQDSHKKCLLFRISPVLSCLAECTNRFIPYRSPLLYLLDKLVFIKSAQTPFRNTFNQICR